MAHLVDPWLDQLDRPVGIAEPRHGAGEVVVQARVVGIEEQGARGPLAGAFSLAEARERRDQESERAAVVGFVGQDLLAGREGAAFRRRGGLVLAQRLVRLHDHARGPVCRRVEFDGSLEVDDRTFVIAPTYSCGPGNGVGLEAVRIEPQRRLERLVGRAPGAVEHAAKQGLGEGRVPFGHGRVGRDGPLRRRPRSIHRKTFDAALAQLGLGQRHQGPALGESRVQLDDASADADDDRLQPFAALALEAPRHEEELVGLGVRRGALLDGRTLLGQELEFERCDDGLRDVVLDGEDVVERAVVALRPDLRVGGRLEQLRRDPHAIAGLAHAALEDVRDLEGPRDLGRRDRLALVREGGVARSDRKRRHPTEVRDDVLGHAVAEVLLLRVSAHVDERQDDHARFRRSRSARGRRGVSGRRIRGHATARCRLRLDQTLHVGDEASPRRVLGVASPTREVRGVGQLKDDRALASVDHHRHECSIAVRERRLGAHPA